MEVCGKNNTIEYTNPCIVLNVGGTHFTTFKSTLIKAEYFKSLIERWMVNEELFLDEDPELFKHVLNILRNPNYIIPEKLKHNVNNLLVYFGVPMEFIDAGMVLTPEKHDDKTFIDVINHSINRFQLDQDYFREKDILRITLKIYGNFVIWINASIFIDEELFCVCDQTVLGNSEKTLGLYNLDQRILKDLNFFSFQHGRQRGFLVTQFPEEIHKISLTVIFRMKM